MLKKAIKYLYKKRGYEIVLRKYKLMDGHYPQSVVLPRATYSPWTTDKDFQEIFRLITAYTLVDVYRCYEIWQLCLEQKSLDGDYIEIGVWKGGTGAIIAKIAQEHSKNSKVYLCDTFEGVVKAGENDNKYINGEHADTSVQLVQGLLDNLNLTNTTILKGMFPDDTGSSIGESKIKFCHIDVDVFKGAEEITNWIWGNLVIGGCIVYDDYGFSGTQGVTKFVESQRGKADRTVIHNLNGHAVIIKIK